MKTLKELNDKELKELYENNQELKQHAWEDAYSDNMDCQAFEADEIGTEVFDYHDHYSSFYLTTPMKYGTRCPELVANKLKGVDYLTKENAELYDKLNKLIDKWEELDYDEQQEEKGEKIYDEAIEVCDKLAEGITEQLRAYEDIDDDYAYDLFKQNAYDGYMSDWEVNEKGEVRQTIYKTYK